MGLNGKRRVEVCVLNPRDLLQLQESVCWADMKRRGARIFTSWVIAHASCKWFQGT